MAAAAIIIGIIAVAVGVMLVAAVGPPAGPRRHPHAPIADRASHGFDPVLSIERSCAALIWLGLMCVAYGIAVAASR